MMLLVCLKHISLMDLGVLSVLVNGNPGSSLHCDDAFFLFTVCLVSRMSDFVLCGRFKI